MPFAPKSSKLLVGTTSIIPNTRDAESEQFDAYIEEFQGGQGRISRSTFIRQNTRGSLYRKRLPSKNTQVNYNTVNVYFGGQDV